MRLNGFRIAQQFSRANDLRTFHRLMGRSWVMGRDGSLASSGGTGGAILSPRRGVSVTGPDSFDLPVPGYGSLKMVMAYDAITNLCPAMTTSSNLASNTLSGLARTLVEDGSTNFHNATSASTFALTDAATYRVRCLLSRAVGARNVWMSVNRSGGPQCQVHIALDASTMADNASGGGATANRSVTALGSKWMVQFDVSAATWGGNARVQYGLRSGAANSYAGDGASGITFEGVTIAPLTDYAPLMAEGIARAADSWIWTLPAALPQDCEITHGLWQPHADGDMGVASQTWTQFIGGSAQINLVRGAATTLSGQDRDGAANRVDTITRTLPNRATLAIQRHVRRSANIEAGYGAALSGSPTALVTAPWDSNTGMYIGHSVTVGRASRAGNAFIVTPGGCTQAERDAVARMFHLRALAAAA